MPSNNNSKPGNSGNSNPRESDVASNKGFNGYKQDRHQFDHHYKGGRNQFPNQRGNKQYKAPAGAQSDPKEQESSGSGNPLTKSFPFGGHNAYSWYAHDEAAIKAIANLPFGNPSGNPLNLHGKEVGVHNKFVNPGICVIKTALNFGQATSLTSAVNVAALDVYQRIRKDNSGAKNYDPSNVMMYFGGVGSLYAQMGEELRLYAALGYVDPMNRYGSKQLIEAMGFDYNDVRGRAADLKAELEIQAGLMNAFPVPATLPFFDKCFWEYSGVYKDADIRKAQMYMFVPSHYWRYYSTADGSKLVQHNAWVFNHGRKLDEVFTSFHTDYDALMNDTDTGNISGDIIKAYGVGGLYKIQVPADLNLKPVYDHEMLWMIHNLRLLPQEPFLQPVTEKDGYISQDLTSTFGAAVPTADIPHGIWALEADNTIDTDTDAPTPEEVILDTRLQAAASVFSTSVNAQNSIVNIRVETCDVFAACDLVVYVVNVTGELVAKFAPIDHLDLETESVGDLISTSQFDYFPVLRCWEGWDVHGQYPEFSDFLGDVTNITTISSDKLKDINSIVLLSLFGVPQRESEGTK